MARREERAYREYVSDEQRRQPRGPRRGSRVGVEEGCPARELCDESLLRDTRAVPYGAVKSRVTSGVRSACSSTTSPARSCSKSRSTSAFRSRMQPCDFAKPTDRGASVPWIPYPFTLRPIQRVPIGLRAPGLTTLPGR